MPFVSSLLLLVQYFISKVLMLMVSNLGRHRAALRCATWQPQGVWDSAGSTEDHSAQNGATHLPLA